MNNLYVNIDCDSCFWPFVMKASEQKNISKELLYPYVDAYKSTCTTDLLFCIFSQSSASKSKYYPSYSDAYEFTVKNNIDDKFMLSSKGFYVFEKEHNIDIFKVLFDRCREIGIRPWMSFRMNDCHHDYMLYPETNPMYFLAKENGWMLGEEYGYYAAILDYKQKEVRESLLAYIDEQICRYDVYGIELDFMREIQCFRYLTDDMNECTKIMTDFVREVKRIITNAEKLHNHKIKIAIRLPRDIVNCEFYGFDIKTFAKEGLVDLIIPTHRFSGNDSGININEWKAQIPKVEIVGGLEAVANVTNKPERVCHICTSAIVRGLALKLLLNGSDGVYLYNFYINPNDEIESSERQTLLYEYGKILQVLHSCGSIDEIYKYPVRCAILPQQTEFYAKAPKLWRPLPKEIDNSQENFEIKVYGIPENKRTNLIVGFDGGFEDAEIFFNEHKCTNFCDVDLSFIPGVGYQKENYIDQGVQTYMCEIPREALAENKQNVLIKSKGKATVCWIELDIF